MNIQNLYNIILLIAAALNLIMGCGLLAGNAGYSNYTVYRRSRLLTAMTFLIFAAGFVAHSQLGWRATWPAGASALSVTYFHAAAVLFSWSHISLLNPNYLTRSIAVRDIAILTVGVIAYWTAATSSSLVTFHFSLLIFFLHALYISYIFYRTLVRVRTLTGRLPQSDDNARWWTDDNRMMVMRFLGSIRMSCHLIIIFGLGSIVVTAAFPDEQWPYIILMGLGIAVFCYIYYSLTNYGTVIEAGTNATEDVAEGKRWHQRAALILALMMTSPMAWAEAESIEYIDADGASKSQSAIVLEGANSPTTLDGGWYAVKTNVTYNGQLQFTGDVSLILCDDAKITVSSGTTNALLVDGNVTIYAQSGGSGALETNAAYNASGIHANSNGHITINGGHITTQSTNGPGISTSGSITINGGNVKTNCQNNYGLRAKDITLGWRSAADRIKAKRYELEGGGSLAVAAGKTITDGKGNIYTGTLDAEKIAAIADKALMGTNLLADANNNTESIYDLADKQSNITLNGRTLYKDGKWNTLCLPFAMTAEQVTEQLAPAKLMTLGSSSFAGEELTLTFVDATTIEAGRPYIIKWENSADHLVNPTFAGITVTKTTANVETDYVNFVGITSPTTLGAADRSVLYLGSENKLYWPSAARTINSCRAYFTLKNGLTVGDNTAQVHAFTLNFGFDDDATGIINCQSSNVNSSDADTWYTLDGRRLHSKPTQKGLYILNGEKMMIQ